MRYTPKKHHTKAIKAAITHACLGLLMDRGLGKTGVMLMAFKILKLEKIVKKMLVVTALRPAYEVWPAEARKWDETQSLKVVVLHGPDKDKLLKQDADIYVINPEGLSWLCGKVIEGDSLPWDILCVDESTMFKHTETVRFKVLKPLLPFFKRRYILTGNPIPNGLLDLFGQIYILDLGHALGNYITYYRLNYFDPLDHIILTDDDGNKVKKAKAGNHKFVIKANGEERIFKKIKPYVLRMAAEDYLNIPPMVGSATGKTDTLITEVVLPPKVRQIYDEMEEELIARIESGDVTAANGVAASGKCRQIANGGLYGNDKSVNFVHDLKTDALEEMIDEFDGVPALVSYEFHHDLARLQKRFPDAEHIAGGVSPKRFSEIMQEWNKGNLRVLFAQPVSVARGLNMQGTRANVVWYGQCWDQEIYDQFNSRAHREGQKFPVFVNHICAKATIDIEILYSLRAKGRVGKRFSDAMKEVRLRRRAA